MPRSCGRIARASLLAATVLMSSCAKTPASNPTTDTPPRSLTGGAGHELANAHAGGSTITTGNVATLAAAWGMRTTEPTSNQPLADAERVYTADWGGNVYALDRTGGNLAWTQHLEEPDATGAWRGFAGTGDLGDDRLYEVSAEGRAFALDPATGKVLWQRDLTSESNAGNVGDVRYFDGKLYVGLASTAAPAEDGSDANATFRGRVLALDAATGETVWERQLARDDQRGVAMWSSFAVDADTGTLYFTTGGPYAGPADGLADSVVALEAKTGRLLWSRRPETTDGAPEFAAGPQLFEAGGRKFVGAGQKSGTYWALDRATGEVVWSTRVGPGGDGGGLVGEASVGQGRLYMWCNSGYAYGSPAAETPALVACLDAASGNVVWTVKDAQPAWITAAGALANGVYLVGSLDGHVRAYDAADGKLLWLSAQHASIASSLTVSGSDLIFGLGVPTAYGGIEGPSGLVGYRLGADGITGSVPTPTPTATPTPSPTPTLTPAPTASPTATPGSIFRRSATPTPSPTETPAPSPTPTPTESPA